MRFVTTYSLRDSWRGQPQIAALQVIPGENNRGVRLILNETPYTGPAQAGQTVSLIGEDNVVHFAPVTPGPQSFVLADKLAYCRFSYLAPLSEAPFQQWRSDWPIRGLLPKGVRIEMAPLEGSPAELHVSTVTVALHVTSDPGLRYDDMP